VTDLVSMFGLDHPTSSPGDPDELDRDAAMQRLPVAQPRRAVLLVVSARPEWIRLPDPDAAEAVGWPLAAADLPAAAAEQSSPCTLAGSVTRVELDDDPVVVQQELPIAPRTGAVVHRVVVTRFPRGTTTAMRSTVTTDRLVAVADLRGTALAPAARIDPIPRGAP
jgi:hypothetical protein